MPDRIGKYLIRREIGRGGMAIVYEADDPDLRRPVALKVIAEGTTSTSAVARLRREAEIAARLRHPHIVPVHEIGQAPGPDGSTLHFIAMDLVEGRTLQHAIGGPDALRHLEEAARAAGHAHAAGVVHRDLKPANILIDSSGRALLADFGLARGDDPRLTREGAVLGTPVYMAPEQIEGRHDVIGPRTDVYALGVILYEILAGRPPFMAATAAEIYAQVLSSEPPRLSGVDRDLESVCRKAMEKDPARRYPDGAAFADDLSRARRGEPILATRPSAVSRLARSLRRRIVPVAAVVGGLVIAAVALTVAATQGAGRLRERLETAARAEDEGRLEDARDAYRGALAIADNEKARSGIGRVEAALARRAEARDLELRTTQARLEAQGRSARLLEQGRPSLDRALALLARPESPAADIAREANAALDLFRRAELEAPSHAHAPYLSGRALDALGDPDGAEASWRRAIELDPNFGPARFLLGRARLVRAFLASCYTRTKPDAEAAASKAAEDFDAATRAGSGFDDEILREVARAMSHYVRGDRASALAVCTKGVAAFGTRPGVEELHWVLAISADPADAIAHYDRCLVLRPHHAAALLGRGLACMQLARYAEAERDFVRVSGLWPRSRDAWNCLGTARHALTRFDDAIVAYGRAIEVDRAFVHALSNRALAHVHRADRLAAGGRRADADEARRLAGVDYDAAIAADPAAALPRNGRGALRMAAGAVEEALADFNEAVRVDPANAEALVNRAIARRALGDGDGALRDLDQCIERHPKHLPALQHRSTLRYGRQDLDGAIADLDRVIAINGGATDFLNRGAFRLMKGRAAEAVDDFTKALERRPRQLDALFNRAVAQVQLEQWKGALTDVEDALDIAPPDWKSRAQAERLRELARSRLKQ